MRKIISSSEKPSAIKKNVQFSQEIDSKEIYRTVIKLLLDSTTYRLSDEKKTLDFIDTAIQLVKNWFEESSEMGRKLLAKCYAEKAISSPLGSERDALSCGAQLLDPTRERYKLS